MTTTDDFRPTPRPTSRPGSRTPRTNRPTLSPQTGPGHDPAPATGPDPAAARTPTADRAAALQKAQRMRAKRRHPARKTRVAAFGLSVVATSTITSLFAHADRASAATLPATAAKTFTGAPSSMKWGTTEVKITVKGKKITDVITVTLPSHTPKSVRLSNHAATVLRSEVLTVQSAHVDTVSGATMTSESYLHSLQSAIDKARAAGALA